MRVIMLGTGPFAVPTFKSLLDSDHEVVTLVTRPIHDAGKRRKSSVNPTRDVGMAAGIKILDPANVNDVDSVALLKLLDADLLVVCDYGQILSRECLAAARLGGINLHGSLLPKYRGAAPINWALYHGETTLGITVIHMTATLDAGPALAQADLCVAPNDTAATIEPRLAELGAPQVLHALELLSQWDGKSPIGEKQDRQLATKAPRLKKSDGLIDWKRTAKQIVDQIRAFQPWPGTFTNWCPQDKQPLRLIVHWAEAVDSPDAPIVCAPGEVALSDKTRLLVQTGDGLLSLKRVQPAGKRQMNIEEFLRGHPPSQKGDRRI
jgi:methionyl-tRNA formyltransferase